MALPTDLFWMGLFAYVTEHGILRSEANNQIFIHTREGRNPGGQITTRLPQSIVIVEMWKLKRELLEAYPHRSMFSWEEYKSESDDALLLGNVKMFWKCVAIQRNPGPR